MGTIRNVEVARNAELAASGGAGRAASSARAGFLPLPLRRVPSGALQDIPVYLRASENEPPAQGGDEFMLYRSLAIDFGERDRERLLENGRRFIYIRIADQARFQRQAERALARLVMDPVREFSERSAIVYETSVAVMNEVLRDRNLPKHTARLENVSRAIATLVLNDPQAFQHLLASAQHDFYTATHMVNVGTWMVPLSHALGYRDHDELCRICQAGLLHDFGKIFVPARVLNKGEPLTQGDWALIREHPALGEARLATQFRQSSLAPIVARQHHERMDGSGYPDGLGGEEIHAISRICAVVDSFDAMTALRPFKQQTMALSDAMLSIHAGAGVKYDADVVRAWLGLLQNVDDRTLQPPAKPEQVASGGPDRERRRNKRFECNFTAQLQILQPIGPEWSERSSADALVHNVSRFGLGLLSPAPVSPGERLRVRYRGAHGTPRVVDGQCVRCRAYEDGWFEIGLELDRSA